ncbi:MAG: PAS domain S-box protein [Cyclobacteriaceae bacterium]|nr:PAS domain S-box protein [Cyclobacteriaceae bacterium]
MNSTAKNQATLMVSKDQKIEMLERAVQAMSRKYEILSRATNDAIWDWDILSDCIEWNHGWQIIYGHKENNIPRAIWIDQLHPLDREEVLDGWHKAVGEHKLNWSAIYRYRCSNGTYKYTYDRAYIVYENEMPVRVIGAMQDIDERMLALQEIEKLSLVASKTENLVIITDANENIEWVNEGFVRRTGYTLREVVGKTPRFLQGPETSREVLDRIRASIVRGESCTEEIINYTKQGSKFWIKMNITPVFNEYNKLHRFVAVETDVTVHKEYENKIIASALELSSLIENANAVIIGVDKNGLVNEWNKQATVVTGYSKHELLGKKLTNIVVGSARQNFVEKYTDHILKGNTINLKEFEIINRKGAHNMLLISATPRKNVTGEIVGLIAVGQDITELTEYRQSLEKKVAERTQELNRSLEKEKELAAIKSQFASTVSHEFRTPLSTIKLSANHIRKYKTRMTDSDIDAKIGVMLKQVEHMTHLLEDVLTISRAEGTKIKTAKVPVVLVEFFSILKDQVERMNNETHTVELQFDLLQPVLYTDPDLLRNIFINLLNNAIKFSPGKSVVKVRVAQNAEGWCVRVQDEGIGFPADDARKIFEPFFRASNATIIQGTGLGLSIVKRAVDLLGGSIDVQSNEGEGSVFHVTIPTSE